MAFKVSKLSPMPCLKCGKPVNKGDRIWWTIESRGLTHAECHGPEPESSNQRAKPLRTEPLKDSERCDEEKVLFGETMRCEFPKAHKQGHSYHFTITMGKRFWKKYHACKDSSTKLAKLMGEK